MTKYIYVIWVDTEDWEDPYNPYCDYTPIGYFLDSNEAHEALIKYVEENSSLFPKDKTEPLRPWTDWAFKATFNPDFTRTIRILQYECNKLLLAMNILERRLIND